MTYTFCSSLYATIIEHNALLFNYWIYNNPWKWVSRKKKSSNSKQLKRDHLFNVKWGKYSDINSGFIVWTHFQCIRIVCERVRAREERCLKLGLPIRSKHIPRQRIIYQLNWLCKQYKWLRPPYLTRVCLFNSFSINDFFFVVFHFGYAWCGSLLNTVCVFLSLSVVVVVVVVLLFSLLLFSIQFIDDNEFREMRRQKIKEKKKRVRNHIFLPNEL